MSATAPTHRHISTHHCPTLTHTARGLPTASPSAFSCRRWRVRTHGTTSGTHALRGGAAAASRASVPRALCNPPDALSPALSGARTLHNNRRVLRRPPPPPTASPALPVACSAPPTRSATSLTLAPALAGGSSPAARRAVSGAVDAPTVALSSLSRRGGRHPAAPGLAARTRPVTGRARPAARGALAARRPVRCAVPRHCPGAGSCPWPPVPAKPFCPDCICSRQVMKDSAMRFNAYEDRARLRGALGVEARVVLLLQDVAFRAVDLREDALEELVAAAGPALVGAARFACASSVDQSDIAVSILDEARARVGPCTLVCATGAAAPSRSCCSASLALATLCLPCR